ncbi:helix-turn-helix domain-containing protein [Nocardioides bizhenqiangii]|uniref:Helix-turn-helix transcriptional regulator n=1 Tax=Nocardioides bizhenqiangii TaxID=3095076 RepID=A0ABZ1A0P7_9ACTN|nr:helix-turn-helix transcriptional regulator [Nocardioides sp. HM61]WQQ28703.1 helix-turn-helix transcriptional regulator [Nocardioides sp. HM61]
MIPAPPVPRALAPYVVARVAYDVDFGAPGVHRGLPGTSLTFVLPLDDPLRVSWGGRSDTLHSAWTSLAGLHAAPAAVHHDGLQRGIQLALTVAGARAVLGVPAAALAGSLTDVDEAVVPRPLRELSGRLHDAVTWEQRIAVVDRTLATLVASADGPGPRAEVGRALARLTRGARVGDVAEEVGYSRRRLSTLVRDECGVTPKEFQRVARFQMARGLLGRRPLAEVAARCGYSDQAHLSREWAALAGCSPTTWLREEFPFVQDRDPAAEAPSEHD